MTIDDIRTMIVSDESRILELKKTTGELKDGMHSACAFLNTEGGWLIFGVTPKSLKIVGQEVTDNTQREIALALAGLEQHDQDDSKAAKQLQNSNNGLHSGQPPNIHSRTGAENHLTEVYNTIALSLFQVHFTKNICQSLTLFIEQMFAFQKKIWYTDCEIHCSGAAAGSCQ